MPWSLHEPREELAALDWRRCESGPGTTMPSQVIKDFVNRRTDEEVTLSDMEELGKQLLLPTNEVEMYVKHLQHIRRRRKAGTRKTAETRRQRRKVPLYNYEF